MELIDFYVDEAKKLSFASDMADIFSRLLKMDKQKFIRDWEPKAFEEAMRGMFERDHAPNSQSLELLSKLGGLTDMFTPSDWRVAGIVNPSPTTIEVVESLLNHYRDVLYTLGGMKRLFLSLSDD